MNETAKHISWTQVANEQLTPLLERRLVNGQALSVASVLLRKGCPVPEHRHVHEQITLVTSGALAFKFPEQTFTVRAGEMVCIPSNLPHSAEAVEDTTVIDIFTPVREDWASGNDAYLRGAVTTDKT